MMGSEPKLAIPSLAELRGALKDLKTATVKELVEHLKAPADKRVLSRVSGSLAQAADHNKSKWLERVGKDEGRGAITWGYVSPVTAQLAPPIRLVPRSAPKPPPPPYHGPSIPSMVAPTGVGRGLLDNLVDEIADRAARRAADAATAAAAEGATLLGQRLTGLEARLTTELTELVKAVVELPTMIAQPAAPTLAQVRAVVQAELGALEERLLKAFGGAASAEAPSASSTALPVDPLAALRRPKVLVYRVNPNHARELEREFSAALDLTFETDGDSSYRSAERCSRSRWDGIVLNIPLVSHNEADKLSRACKRVIRVTRQDGGGIDSIRGALTALTTALTVGPRTGAL